MFAQWNARKKDYPLELSGFCGVDTVLPVRSPKNPAGSEVGGPGVSSNALGPSLVRRNRAARSQLWEPSHVDNQEGPWLGTVLPLPEALGRDRAYVALPGPDGRPGVAPVGISTAYSVPTGRPERVALASHRT